ncbi:hypothetical protein IY145_19215 [Methylosinus sp. H3A]|uniref:hypothetical protein n=1 Tax=Methylosinus sp. H3A TaxID=2785786 RepID=UPI0018C26239|nr:hypothetical protein [Methylosinus sp. H3A]MBG0811486.1 hypothetical protein [Methylosinus sp. H3A]
MSMTFREATAQENAAVYGGLVDAVGGIATIVLAVCGLAGVNPPLMAGIATIVFGVALLIQGGTMLSEYAQIIFPAGAKTANFEHFGGGSLSAVFLVGAAGIVLGVLSLLGINSGVLTPIATIAFGTALVLSSNAVWHLYTLRHAQARNDASASQSQNVGGEFLASEMASGSAGIQALAGLGAIVLGVLAVAGSSNDLVLNLVALLALGATVVLTGSTLSATVLSFMRPWSSSQS